MPELTPKQHRNGLAFADRVALMASEAPDPESKRELYSAVHAIRKRYGWTKDEKRREIVRVVLLGASKVSDIQNETRFVEQDIRELAREMVKDGVLRCVQLGRTGGGRPSEQYFPVESDLSYP